MGTRNSSGDGHVKVSADRAAVPGSFERSQRMDAAPPPTSTIHEGSTPAPSESRRPASRRGGRSANQAALRPEAVEDAPVAKIRASRESSGMGQMIAVAVVAVLVVMTCAGVGLTGMAMVFGGGAGEAAAEPVEPELPTRTGSRGEIPVERGLRRGAGDPEPEPSRPDVPDPNE